MTAVRGEESGEWGGTRTAKGSARARLNGASLFPPERTALGQSRLAPAGLAQDLGAALAYDHRLGMGEHGGDVEASGALDIHKERSRGRHQKLQLVRRFLCLGQRMEDIVLEDHR